jgi:catechol 2,3-dioxygenase-like lactoylglutathione lyase family enzyme
MNALGLSFHHLGLAVKRQDEAVRFLQSLGYTLGAARYDPHQEVHLILCQHPQQPTVELIYPTERTGPLAQILKHQDSLIYHICYSTADIPQAATAIKTAGHRVIPVSPPTPAPLFDNRAVAFYWVKGFGLIELLQEKC